MVITDLLISSFSARCVCLLPGPARSASFMLEEQPDPYVIGSDLHAVAE